MAKQTENSKAVTNSQVAELSVRDCIRTLKQNRRAIRTLTKIGAKTPGIADAIAAVLAKNEEIKKLAVQSVLAQIEQALKEDDE